VKAPGRHLHPGIAGPPGYGAGTWHPGRYPVRRAGRHAEAGRQTRQPKMQAGEVEVVQTQPTQYSQVVAAGTGRKSHPSPVAGGRR